MREILFKAKTEYGRWVEGDLIHYESGEVAILEKPFSKYGYEAIECSRRTKVLKETICQYTGLTDKNGNKIWENDIVNLCEDFYIITWEKDEAMFVLEDVYVGLTESFKSADSRWCEVVGNTIDNPELLDKQIETKFD